jgi:hypothetical protein
LTFVPDDDLGFVVLCNLHDTRMTLALTNSLIDLYCGCKTRNWNAFYRKIEDDSAAERKRALAARDQARDPNAKRSLPLGGYTGTYKHPAFGDARITEKNGRLALIYGNFTCPLDSYEGDTFRIRDGFFTEQLVTFVVKDGKAVKVKFQGQEFKK